ncbi:hypothetical protein Dimus_036844 [Dionaea muscipula]
MTVIHLKKKDVVKSCVKGISIEFDHERLAAILDVPGRTGICEYIKEVWEESRIMSCHYGDWLTLVFEAFGVPLVIEKGEEPKKYDFFEDTFLTMCELTRENGIWWIGSGENRRRDDDEAAQEEETRKGRLRRMTLVGKSVIDEATIEGESGSDDRFYDARIEVEEPSDESPATQRSRASSPTQREDKEPSRVDPSGLIAEKLNLRNSERI